MAATLAQTLLAPETQPAVINDCLTLIKEEVADLSGVSGAAVKVAFKTVNAFAADHIRYTLEVHLPLMAQQLEPYWADFNASGGSDFGDYVTKRGDEVSESLLAITDASAKEPTARPVIVKAYGAVRGHAAKHVVAALPRLGTLVQKYGAA
jgi:hypothetical protein